LATWLAQEISKFPQITRKVNHRTR
jgi:hypothetical protein